MKDIPMSVVKGIVHNGLFPRNNEFDFSSFSRIIVDLDSILSLVLHFNVDETNESEKYEFGELIVNNIGYFINDHQYTFIDIYCRMNTYDYFTSIYPDWCKERQSRYKNTSMIDFIDNKLIKKLKKLESRMNNFRFIRCEDSPILQIKKDIEMYKEDYIIISRDPHYNCLFNKSNKDVLHIYNGKSLYDYDSFNVRTKIEVDATIIGYFYLISGMKRNEYKGVLRMGDTSTVKHMRKNLLDVINFKDSKAKEVEKYKELFFIK